MGNMGNQKEKTHYVGMILIKESHHTKKNKTKW